MEHSTPAMWRKYDVVTSRAPSIFPPDVVVFCVNFGGAVWPK
jgi:hypothetical protein